MKTLRTASWSVLLLALSQLKAAAIGGPDISILTAPLSQSVASGAAVTFSVIATAPGLMQFQWRHGDRVISGAKDSSLTLTDVQIEDAGQYVVSVIGAGRRVDAPVAVLTVDGVSVQDVAAPRLGVTSPAASFIRTLSSDLMIVGTASDDTGVAGICYQQNGGEWVVLPSATNWMFNASLVPGTNQFLFKASDIVGNFSPTQKVTAFYSVTQSLSLTVVGGGQVVGAANGLGLEVGKFYSLKALPSVGSYFSSWDVNGVVSTNPTLNFLMGSETAIVATFVGNPFVPLDGVYTGLVYDTNNPAHETSGFLTFKLTEQGRFTGRLMLAGEALSLSGQFGMDLRARQTVARRLPNPAVTVELQLSPDAEWVTGTVGNNGQSSVIEAYRSVFHASLNPATNHAGKYTMAFSGGATGGPSGNGHGAVTVSTAGSVQFKGTLADGSAAAHKVPLASNGQWPLYVLLYKGKGSIFGWLTLADAEGSDVSGQLLWTKPAGVAGVYHPSGFVTELGTKGSRYEVPAPGTRVLNVSNGVVRLTGGNLSEGTTDDMVLTELNKFIAGPTVTNRLALKVTTSSGLMSGSFTHPQTLKKSTIKGVVLQKQNAGSGFFLGTNQSGAVFFGLPEDFPLFESAQ